MLSEGPYQRHKGVQITMNTILHILSAVPQMYYLQNIQL